MTTWFVYIIRSADGSLYTGITTDVQRRLNEHRIGGRKGSKYLRGKGPLKLEWSVPAATRSCALKAERQIKKLPKSAKEILITQTKPLPDLLNDL